MMDYKKLLEPYRENGRTLEGQVLWLKKKGFDETVIMKAMENTYFQLSQGKQFEDGNSLDQYLLETARGVATVQALELVSKFQGSVVGRFFRGLFKK